MITKEGCFENYDFIIKIGTKLRHNLNWFIVLRNSKESTYIVTMDP